jgi:hypothetical protein
LTDAKVIALPVEVSSSTVAGGDNVLQEPPVALLAPAPVIVYVVVWPADSVPAASVGGALATVTVGVLTAVALVLVATVKLKLEVGAVAVNVTVTVVPAAMDGHALEFNVIVTPEVVPTVVGVVPAWRHEPAIKATVELLMAVGSAVEVPMVTVLPVARAFTATNVTVKVVATPEVAEVGVTVTLLTPPDGAPMVYVLVTHPGAPVALPQAVAAEAGSALTAATLPKPAKVRARVPASSLARLHPRLGDFAKGCSSCI